jgi:single-strand DNA-binding protein
VILVGNLTRDAEPRDLPNGGKVYDMGMAVNERFKNRAGEIEDRPMFISLAMYDTKERLGWMIPHLKKGTKVTVDGKLRYETWDDKVTGAKHSKHSVVVNSIEADWPKKGQTQPHQSQSYQPQEYQPQDAYEDSDIPF